MPNILIDSSGGNKLESIYKPSSDETAPLVILLHPHPMYGGDMNNKVLVYMEKIFLQQGFTTLRFNFRGCGKSDGNYEGGSGELIDASTCLDWLQARHPAAKKVYVVGFSFGAYIALQLMVRRTEINYFIAVSTPTNMFDISFVHPCPINGLFVHAEKDELCPLKDADKMIKKITKVKNRTIDFKLVKDADHFFTNKLSLLQDIIQDNLENSDKYDTENNEI